MTMLMKKTMKQTALAMAIVFSLSGCAFAAPSHGKMNGHGVSRKHAIEKHVTAQHGGRHDSKVLVKTVHRPEPRRVEKVYVHDAPRVVHHYDDRYCDSSDTGTAIAAGLIGLILGAAISSSCD